MSLFGERLLLIYLEGAQSWTAALWKLLWHLIRMPPMEIFSRCGKPNTTGEVPFSWEFLSKGRRTWLSGKTSGLPLLSQRTLQSEHERAFSMSNCKTLRKKTVKLKVTRCCTWTIVQSSVRVQVQPHYTSSCNSKTSQNKIALSTMAAACSVQNSLHSIFMGLLIQQKIYCI